MRNESVAIKIKDPEARRLGGGEGRLSMKNGVGMSSSVASRNGRQSGMKTLKSFYHEEIE